MSLDRLFNYKDKLVTKVDNHFKSFERLSSHLIKLPKCLGEIRTNVNQSIFFVEFKIYDRSFDRVKFIDHLKEFNESQDFIRVEFDKVKYKKCTRVYLNVYE